MPAGKIYKFTVSVLNNEDKILIDKPKPKDYEKPNETNIKSNEK